jgi:four helix bundle protein
MEKPSKSFRDVIVWRKAHAFVLTVYGVTDRFPKSEVYGLCSQFRRAAVSIPANIAEGFKKRGKADKLRYYNIAQGSLEECQYYVILAHDLNYADTTTLSVQLDEVARLLESYAAALEASY